MTVYPEHERLRKVHEKSQAIGEFLDWLMNEQHITLARWERRPGDEDRLFAFYTSISDLLARYYHIDQTKLEQEKTSISDLLARYYHIDQTKLEQEKRQMLAEFVKKADEEK